MTSMMFAPSLLSSEELCRIRKTVEQEFPGDMALQEIHIARKILAREAEQLGLTYLAYIKRLASSLRT